MQISMNKISSLRGNLVHCCGLSQKSVIWHLGDGGLLRTRLGTETTTRLCLKRLMMLSEQIPMLTRCFTEIEGFNIQAKLSTTNLLPQICGRVCPV